MSHVFCTRQRALVLLHRWCAPSHISESYRSTYRQSVCPINNATSNRHFHLVPTPPGGFSTPLLVPIIDSRNFNSYGSLEKLPPVLQTWKLRPYRFPLTVASHPQFNELTDKKMS